MWAWYKSIQPFSTENYSAITGILESKQEEHANKSIKLNFSIRNNPIQFQIPDYFYEKEVNRALFSQKVHPGESVAILVDKSELDALLKRPTKSEMPLKVFSFTHENTDFLTLEAQKERIEDHKSSTLISAWMVTVFSLVLIALYFKIIPNQIFEEESPSPN